MNARVDTTAHCCAECGIVGGVSLKTCKACMQTRYCNPACQHKHWPKHKKDCKLRAAELRDKSLFKDPPPKEDCPICFLPMPKKLISCMSLPPATILAVPTYDFALAHDVLASENMERYYSCCGKSICAGCMHSFVESGNIGKCAFCNCNRVGKLVEERVEDIMKRVEADDPVSIGLLANYYHYGSNGLQEDQAKAVELFTRAADLGCSKAHNNLGSIYHEGGAPKKAKFHFEAAAMAGHEVARFNLGAIEINSGNKERALKHWTIAASAGYYAAIHSLRKHFEIGVVTRESIDSILTAYNNSCAEMRSEARDAYIRAKTKST